MKKFISIFVLILVIIGLVIGLGYSCKVIINKDKEILTLTQENTDLKNTITTLNNTIENIQDSTDEEKDTPKEDNNTKVSVIFDQSKVANNSENATINQIIYDDNGIINISVENNSLILNLDAKMARQVYGYLGENITHTVTGFQNSIVDAKIMSTDNSSSGIKVVMVMSDGSVKYIDISSILDKTYTVHTVANAQDIIKIIQVSVKTEESETLGVIGIKSDGTSVILEW